MNLRRSIVFLAGGLALLTAGFIALPEPPTLPAFETVKSRWTPSEASLLDRHGVVIHELRRDYSVRRLEWVKLDEVSPALKRAVVAGEDRRFFSHSGVDWRALLAAAVQYLSGEGRRGASTLSMQVAALVTPGLGPGGTGRSPDQKLSQLHAALILERHWSKAQIQEAYLNLVGFRGELQGIAAASRGLFGKHPSGLTEAESVLLAALLPSPNASPIRVADRACRIVVAATLTPTCGELSSLADRVLASYETIAPSAKLAPHLAHRLLGRAGESVPTTLDARIQRIALAALDSRLRGLGDANVRDGAALVVDNASGEVLAYVGSAGPASTASQVDGVLAVRQAGSTLKPFLYGLALEKRYLTAASILDDSPLELETGAGLYVPQNYDRDFKGLVSVRTALAGSLNIPAIRTLIMTGLEPFRDRLRDHGYLAITRPGEYYGYSLALGSAEVSLWQQVNAYRSLVNGGRFGPLRLRADDPVGDARQVLDPGAAFIVTDILADRAGRALTFGLHNPLATRYWSAVKTGTSKDMRDNWCIGFSPRYTVGVWVGNFEGDAMRRVSGVTGAAPAWHAIMDALHGGVVTADAGPAPSPPEGVVAEALKFEPSLEPPRVEWFLTGTETSTVVLADPAQRPPSIASPPQGAVVALDPDIPAESQRIVFSARGAVAGLIFVLDGEVLAPADRLFKWLPLPGRHRLELRDRDGNEHDGVSFEVRRPVQPQRVTDSEAEEPGGGGNPSVQIRTSTSEKPRLELLQR